MKPTKLLKKQETRNKLKKKKSYEFFIRDHLSSYIVRTYTRILKQVYAYNTEK